MRPLAFLLVLVSAFYAHALIAPTTELTGYVASFDESTVKLYVSGRFVQVPKTSLTADASLVIGNEVTAVVKPADVKAVDTKKTWSPKTQ